MSGDCKEPNLKSSEVESSVQESSSNVTKKKEKKNYCHVCEVQCTAAKNFEEHKKGRKHLKKLSDEKIAQNDAEIAQEQIKITKKCKKYKQKKVKSQQSVHQTSTESHESNEKHETMMSHSNHYSSPSKRFINSDRDNLRNKYKTVNNNQSYQSRSNNHYKNYSNPYNYKNQSYFSNAQYSNFNGWSYGPYAVPPLLNGASYNAYLPNGNLYPPYGYNSENFYSFPKNRSYPYNSNQCANHPSSSQEYDQNSTAKNENSPTIQTYSEIHAKNEKSEREPQVENLNSKNSENSENLSYNSSWGDINSQESVSSNVRQHIVHSNNFSNESATSVADVAESNGSKQLSSPIPNISSNKKNEKRKVRSRSLSSSECSSNEKRIKDGMENQSADVDTVAKQQSIKDWANTLRKTNPGQISRLIHPSNYKDKAAVNQLITNLSKSKRKENLTKLKSNSLGSNENFEEEESDIIEEEIEKIVESVILVSDNISSNSKLEELPSTESNSDVEHNTESRRAVKKSKKSSVSKNTESDIESISRDNSGKLKISKKSVQLDSLHEGIKISNQSNGKNKGTYLVSSEESATGKMKSPSNPEKPRKRKTLTIKSKSKKQRYSDAESFEKISDDQSKVQADVTSDIRVATLDTGKVTNVADSSSIALPIKRENSETHVQDPVNSATDDVQISQPPGLDFDCEFTADTLMQLFATGSVKVKKEFYDPVIDAIKSVDPNELINACSSKSSQNNANEGGNKALSSDSSVRIPKDKSVVSRSSTSKGVINENNDGMNPVILGSITTSDSIPIVSNLPNNSHSLSDLISDSQSASSSNETDKNTTDSSLLYVKNMNLIPRDKSDLSPHLKKLIKDLQEIASQEETVKQSIAEAKNKINEYQTLLDEWKNKKKKLHDEEEDLRKKRNDIIKLMQNAVKPSSETKDEVIMDASHMPEKKTNSVPVSDDRQYQRPICAVRNERSSNSSQSLKATKTLSKRGKTNKLPEMAECDEITVIPVPVKEPEIVIIDDADDTKVAQASSEDSDDIEEEIVTNVISNNVPSVFDMKELTGHTAAINCIVVFEDFLYTCSNDNTAKRFNLKDPSQTVVYMHTAKNVTEIVVEKVQNEALVFTSCSNRVISLFIAASGTKIKTFFQSCAIMSICRGWGKFYSGMANGIINVYNWKYEEREFVKIEHPAIRIATAHQGRLHFLVILSSNGNISLRDAETGLLIRYIKGFVKLPSWLIVHNDLAYLSSSDRTLTVLDIMTGRVEKKMYLSCITTGLGVFEDFIFAISNSGILNCYSKERASDRKIFYGAGKSCLTCIHVHQNWVFTGNRKGDISVFNFDPSCSMDCKFGSCSYTFGLKGDLEYHLEKDHLMRKKNLARCHWAICCFAFPPNWNIEDKMHHMQAHIM